MITSRNQLRALVSQHDATAISLRQLDPEAARSLLAAVLGEDRLDAEPRAAREIVERCAGLPLALRVFAERVSRFPGTSLREFVAELVGARLDALSDFDDVDVRTVFSWSYRALDEESARMFRLLSVHPGPDFDVTAAALAGVPVARARRLLERLVADHLVQSRTPGRYDLHDLLRAYAAELCGDDEAAALRLTEWQVHTLENARALERGQIEVHADAITSGVLPQEFTARFDAIAWVRQEWDNLRAVLHMAVGRGWGRLAMMIPLHLDKFTVFNRSRRSEAVETYEAVQQFGTAREQGIRLLRVAGLYTDVGRFDDALACFAGALSFAREAGERDTEAAALINQALLHTALNRPADALDSARRAAGISAEMGDRYLESAALANISFYLNRLGRYEEALEEAERAAVLVAELDDDYLTARVWALQGRALATLGRFGEAADRLSAAAEVMVRFGDADNEAVALEHLGVALAGLGRRGEASAAWQRAIGLWRDRDDPEAEQHAERVAALEREKDS